MSKKKAGKKPKRKTGSKSKPAAPNSTAPSPHIQPQSIDPGITVSITELVSRLLINGPKPLAIVHAAVRVKYYGQLPVAQKVFSELFESWICDESPLIRVDVIHGDVALSLKSEADDTESAAKSAESDSHTPTETMSDDTVQLPDSTGPVTAVAMLHDAATQSSAEDIFRRIVDARLRHVKSIPINEARWRVEQDPQFPTGAFFQVLARLIQAGVYQRIQDSTPPSIC